MTTPIATPEEMARAVHAFVDGDTLRPVATIEELARAIRDVPDFPKPGILFKDITPVLADARLFAGSIDRLTEHFQPGARGRGGGD